MTLYDEAEARWTDRKFEELDEKLEQEEKEEPEDESGWCKYFFHITNYNHCDLCVMVLDLTEYGHCPHWEKTK